MRISLHAATTTVAGVGIVMAAAAVAIGQTGGGDKSADIKAGGMSTGNVSTAEITDATPAISRRSRASRRARSCSASSTRAT
jgi:alkaline phosphatase